MTSYLTAADARTMAASLMTLPGMAALLAKDDATLAGVLLTASGDIDVAFRYQGRKYDLSVDPTTNLPVQDREFPRLPYGQPINVYGVQLPSPVPLTPDCVIWDWDGTKAIVPVNVKLACLYQAAWLMQPEFAQRLENIRSGLVSQDTGPVREMTIKSGEAAAGGFSGLGDRASRIMILYRLRSGRML